MVKAGDTLGGIAKDNGTTVAAILAINKGQIKDPDRIRAGQKIRVS